MKMKRRQENDRNSEEYTNQSAEGKKKLLFHTVCSFFNTLVINACIGKKGMRKSDREGS